MSEPRKPQAGTIVRVAALAALALSGSAPACDTPVFRFAMYSPQWAPAPYVVFAVGEVQADNDIEAVNQHLQAAEEDKGGAPNLRFRRLDAADAAAIDDLPAAVRKVYESRGDKKKPFYAVVNPRGDVVFSGGMTPEDAQALLDSPARRELGRQMSQGNVVLLLVEGKDAKANQAAENTVKEAIRMVSEGRLDAIRRPGAPELGAAELVPAKAGPAPAKSNAPPRSNATPRSGADPPGSTTPKVALVKVSRSDAQEAWLVRMLMRADQDLDEVADRPMVFPIYGRARALPPCIGEGITKENLLDDRFGLGFLAGPCSCEVKDGNPGTDLLTSIDWPRVAAAMARVYGDEDSADRMGDVTTLVPRLDAAPRQDGGPAASAGGTQATNSRGLLPNLDPPTDDQPAAKAAADGASPASADSEGESPETPPSSAAGRSLKTVGILVACMAVVAVMASLLFLRPGGRGGA